MPPLPNVRAIPNPPPVHRLSSLSRSHSLRSRSHARLPAARAAVPVHQRVHLAARLAHPARIAEIGVQLGLEIRAEVLRRLRETLGRREHAATAAAATANEQWVPGVLGLQDEAFFIGSVQKFERILPADGSGLADAHHLASRHTQRETVLLEAGLRALLSQQFPPVT